jgi:hypothetical protein
MLRKLSELTGFVLLIWAGLGSCSSGTDGVTGVDPEPAAPFWDLVRTIDGLRSDGFPRIAIDRGNSVYIAGTSDGHQVFLAKHDADGNLVWLRKFSGAGPESVESVGIDPAGRIYIAGDVYSETSHRSDCFLALYDGSGALLRLQSVDITGMTTTLCVAASDAAGNFYVGGNATVGPGVSTDMFVAKYDKDGTPLWSQVFGSSPGAWNDDMLRGVAIDAAGGVYVAGGTVGSFDGATKGGLFVLKFDAAGNRIWGRQYNNPNYLIGLGSISGMVADPDGGVYVAGLAIDWQTDNFFGNTNVFLGRFGADGSLLWTRTLDGGDYDVGTGVAADRRDAYVVGVTTPGSGGHEITEPRQNNSGFLASFSRSGTLASVRLLTSSLGAWATGVALAPNGDLYVTGNFNVEGQFTGAAIFARHHGALP